MTDKTPRHNDSTNSGCHALKHEGRGDSTIHALRASGRAILKANDRPKRSFPVPSGACRGGVSRAGIVLFVVMVVIVMISLAGLSFVMTMSTENQAVHLGGDQLWIGQVAASGEELLRAFSELSRQERQQAGGRLDNEELFRGVLVGGDAPGGRRARFSIVCPRIDENEVTGIRFGVENESARLNLLVLPQWEKEQEGAARDALMNLPGMTEPIADAVLDWIDVDATPRASGAEAEYYAGLRLPYRPRNGIPTSLEELLLIRDVSRELLFGADADFNYQVEAAESQLAPGGAGAGVGQSGLPWASLLTVYSAERNVSYEGKPRINLNEKDLAKLHDQLNEVFDPDWAKFIIAYRQFGPYDEDALPPEGAPGERPAPPRGRGRARRARSAPPARTADAMPELDLSRPAKFNLDSVLDLVGVRVRIRKPNEHPGDDDPAEEAPPDAPTLGPRPPRPLPGTPRAERRGPLVIDSPFQDDRLAMRDYLTKLVESTTVSGDQVIRGRINVDEAPRAVLQGVPGLERAQVDQIVSMRRGRSDQDDPERRYPTWLLTEGIVELEPMKKLLPYLTTGGDVFRAQVVGYFDGSGPSARAEVVVDGTTSPPRQVYWKDLRLLGRGYSLETLGAELTSGEAAEGAGISGAMPPAQ